MSLLGYKKKYFLDKKKKQTELEPHEILFYAEKQRAGTAGRDFWEERLELPLKPVAFIALFGVVCCVLALLFGRFIFLQVFQGNYYATLAETNTNYVFLLHAPRGVMYDRNGEALTTNRKTYDVFFDGRIQDSLPSPDVILLSDILKLSPIEIRAFIESAENKPQLLASDISQETSFRITALFNTTSGVRVEPNYIREYREPYSLSHVVGYTGYVKEEDLQDHPDFSFQDLIGKSGLELSYDEFIRGKNGRIITKVDSQNEILGEANTKESIPGSDLLLNIDGGLQEKIYDVFQRRGVAQGAAVALETGTGRVLALVSIPGFDANAFSSGIDQETFDAIVTDPKEPLFTRTISGQYPPASTIKPFIALASLEEEIIDPERYIYAEGAITVSNIYNPEIVYRFSDWKEHGYVNMADALAVSSNVYFYHIGGGFGDIVGLGIEKIRGHLERFGLGNVLGIDIRGEASGFLPYPSWKQNVKGEDWYIGDTYNVSIGQGDISLTPLQLASATAAIASNGHFYKPQLVNAILHSEGGIYREFPPEIIHEYHVSQNNIDVVKQGMRKAVLSGSSRFLSDLSVTVAGKTGTAQVSKKKAPHAWWTGFAPYENPEIALTILVENGGEGSTAAVPIAKEVLGWYFGNRQE